MVTVYGWVVNETPRAIFFLQDGRTNDKPICLPKSQVRVADDFGGFKDLLTLPRWLAAKVGLLKLAKIMTFRTARPRPRIHHKSGQEPGRLDVIENNNNL